MFALIHTMIRNDEHCPICRRYYISVHKSKEDALNQLTDLEEKQSEQLKTYNHVWIDEWERRRNGDDYEIIKITSDKIYNLHKLSKDVYKEGKEGEVKYLFLHINVNKNKWCPDNLNYKISFHTTKDKAYEYGTEVMTSVNNDSDNSDNEDGDDYKSEKKKLGNSEPELRVGQVQSAQSVDSRLAKLISNSPVWIKDDDKGNGNHYQIIQLELDKELYLNGFCKEIHPDVWKD